MNLLFTLHKIRLVWVQMNSLFKLTICLLPFADFLLIIQNFLLFLQVFWESKIHFWRAFGICVGILYSNLLEFEAAPAVWRKFLSLFCSFPLQLFSFKAKFIVFSFNKAKRLYPKFARMITLSYNDISTNFRNFQRWDFRDFRKMKSRIFQN